MYRHLLSAAICLIGLAGCGQPRFIAPVPQSATPAAAERRADT